VWAFSKESYELSKNRQGERCRYEHYRIGQSSSFSKERNQLERLWSFVGIGGTAGILSRFTRGW